MKGKPQTESAWFAPRFTRRSSNWWEDEKDVGAWTIVHPLVGEIGVKDCYNSAKHALARRMAEMERNKYQMASKGYAGPKKLRIGRYLWKASYILRLMRADGIELSRPKHTLTRFKSTPAIDPHPDSDLVRFWSRDRIYRGCAVIAAKNNLKFRDWDELHSRTLEYCDTISKCLIKPIRVMAMNGKISVSLAFYIARFDGKKEQDMYLANDPRHAYSSERAYRATRRADEVRLAIREYGRTPSRDIRPGKAWTDAGITGEHVIFIHTLGRAGGVVPTSIRGLKQLHKDMHDRHSRTYQFVNSNSSIPHWKLNAPVQELLAGVPLEGCELEVLDTAERLKEEGRRMKHCVGGYVGVKGLFAHVRRGDDEVTLFVAPDGRRGSQCFGKHNATTDLSKHLYEHIPLIQTRIHDELFTAEVVDTKEVAISYE